MALVPPHRGLAEAAASRFPMQILEGEEESSSGPGPGWGQTPGPSAGALGRYDRGLQGGLRQGQLQRGRPPRTQTRPRLRLPRAHPSPSVSRWLSSSEGTKSSSSSEPKSRRLLPAAPPCRLGRASASVLRETGCELGGRVLGVTGQGQGELTSQTGAWGGWHRPGPASSSLAAIAPGPAVRTPPACPPATGKRASAPGPPG